MSYPLVFEKHVPGRRGWKFPEKSKDAKKASEILSKKFLREDEVEFPELYEVDVVRHYINLSKRNYAVDIGFYPLGSCTMKYNPKINEDSSSLPGFNIHPLQEEDSAQGTMRLMHELLKGICEITGMSWGTLQPFAGAQGEFTALKLFRAYFDSRGEKDRRVILVPDSAHGTNPASAHIAGFEVLEVPSDREGMISPDAVSPHCNERLAGIMLTNPNTLGKFEKYILEIAKMVHGAGGLLYYDGANLNAIMGQVRPGDMGFDAVHLNLHKTFSTPHGGGGPGAGPVLVGELLTPFLPAPDIREEGGQYRWDHSSPQSIGKVAGFYGNVAVLVRAYTYLLSMGSDGLSRVSELAVLNANYVKAELEDVYHLPFPGVCKHEFVLSAEKLKKETGVSALDVAKMLVEEGIHPPTVYFPLIVHEALMIEPTETESKETLDHFIRVMKWIKEKAEKDPDFCTQAPYSTPVRRLDEVRAARTPVLTFDQSSGN